MFEIKKCSTDLDFSNARQITNDYIEWLNINLSFQDIEQEFADFSSMYGSPNGIFLLALNEGNVVGGVGLRILTPEICEMKRLFVYNQFKRMGIGGRLCTRIIDEAKRLNYEKMRLDTLGRMETAIRLYESLGFNEIEPYRFNPDTKAKYMELDFEKPALFKTTHAQREV